MIPSTHNLTPAKELLPGTQHTPLHASIVQYACVYIYIYMYSSIHAGMVYSVRLQETLQLCRQKPHQCYIHVQYCERASYTPNWNASIDHLHERNYRHQMDKH